MHKEAYLNMKAMLFPNQIMVQDLLDNLVRDGIAEIYIYTPYIPVTMWKKTTDHLLLGEFFFFSLAFW